MKLWFRIIGLIVALGLLAVMVVLVFITPLQFSGVCCIGVFIGSILYIFLYLSALYYFMDAYEDGPDMPLPQQYYRGTTPEPKSWLDEPVEKEEQPQQNREQPSQ